MPAARTTGRRPSWSTAVELDVRARPRSDAGHVVASSSAAIRRVALTQRRRSCSTARSSATSPSRSTACRCPPTLRGRATHARSTILAPPASGRLTVQATINPAANVALEGLYVSSGVFCTQCEAEGFRRITYFPDRPDVLATYTVTIDRRPRALSRAAVERQSRRRRSARPAAATSRRWHDPFPKPTYLFALVAGDLAALEDTFTTMSRPHGRARDLVDAAQPAALHARDGLAQARDALGRGALRPRVRPRPLHDLLRRRLQHGRDGEQGPQHLQQPARAGRRRRPRPTTTTRRSRA